MFIAVLLIKCGSENDVLLICSTFGIGSICLFNGSKAELFFN